MADVGRLFGRRVTSASVSGRAPTVALLQAALCVLLRRFAFSLHPGHNVVLKSKLILTAAHGMVMDVTPRVRA